jgi:hypothetical protein
MNDFMVGILEELVADKFDQIFRRRAKLGLYLNVANAH